MNPRERLQHLEETNEHVFHGSPKGDIEELEPRQSNHIPDLTKPDEFILDGNPAVSATPYADLAIFRAIINGENMPFPHNSGFGTDEKGVKNYSVSSQEVLDHAKDKKGYVYVFDKKGFEPYDRDGRTEGIEKAMEWRSHEKVKPKEIIEVTSDHLPNLENIKIGNEDE